MTPSDKDRIALAKWFASNDTGSSSKAMAAVYLAGCNVFSKGTDNTPRDAPDLGRCIRLVALCPNILLRPTVYTLGQQHPVWREYLDHWSALVTLFNKGDYHVTTGYMDVLRDYANGKANYIMASEYYLKHTVDPLQHIKDALKAGRQVQRLSMALPPQLDSQDHHWYYILSTVCPYPEHAEAVAWYNNPHNHRVLLNHTDIKPTTVFRNKGVTMGYVAVSEVTENGVYFNNNVKQIVPWHDLADTAEYSHDGVTWKPCLVPQPK